jgi:hypothetical protein
MSSSQLPRILIRYSPLLDEHYRVMTKHRWPKYFKKNLKNRYPSEKSIRNVADSFQKTWEPVAASLLTAMQEITSLKFNEREVVAYVVGAGRAQSDPLVLPSTYSPTHIIGVLAHELLHRLFTYNTAGHNEDIEAPKLYPQEKPTVAVHAILHAHLEYLYREILKRPDLLTWDIQSSKRHGDYARAWDIVAEKGYLNILKDIAKVK